MWARRAVQIRWVDVVSWLALLFRWLNFMPVIWIEIADNVQITIAEIATMDRLDAMNLFVRVAELGSFSAAAKQLGVARSMVTRQIAALERTLASS
jgi:molybdenum-dependent DNA-binding transcriptional regulator ModE